MAREYRVLTALARSPVPVPRTLIFAGADSALGSAVLRDGAGASATSAAIVCRPRMPTPPGTGPRSASRSSTCWRRCTALDPESVGLGDFGRPHGFMERQLRRFSEQWERSKLGDLPALDALRDDLVASLPPPASTAIVHGDYRLDNMILHPARPGEIVAVLDWEMSTLGDPLADLGDHARLLERSGRRRAGDALRGSSRR